MLPLVVALNVATTVGIEDRTEVRARAVNSPRVVADPVTKINQPRTDPNGDFVENDSKTALVMDLETDPVVRVRTYHEDNAFTLAYAPRIALANFGGAGAAQGGKTTVDLVHRPLLTLEQQIDPLNRFVLNGLVQFGRTTPGTLLLPDRWNGEDRPAIPRAFPVLPFNPQTFLSIYAAAGITHTFSPRLNLTLSAFYITFGQPTEAGRIAAGGTTYLQNPGANLEVEYKTSSTGALVFNVAPQVNIVQATVVETDNTGNQLATDGGVLYDGTGVRKGPDGKALGPKFLNRAAPNTYQLYFEARYRKRLERLTAIEVALGANLIQQTLPQALLPTGKLNPDGTPQTHQVDNPFNILGRDAATKRPDKNNVNVLPVAELLVSRGFSTASAQGRLIAYTRADAWLNTVSGNIGARSATVAALNLDFGLDALRAQAAFVQSLHVTDLTNDFRQVIAELSYERELTKSWFFDVGARAGYQAAQVTAPEEGVTKGFKTSFFQPGAFAGVAWRPLPAKL